MVESGKNDANAEEKTQGQNDSDMVKRQEDVTTLKAADLRKYGCVKKLLTICVCQLGLRFRRIYAVTSAFLLYISPLQHSQRGKQ